MDKGIIYVMTTVVDGLVKIGKTGSTNFQQRMYNLERDGYRNITGLKRHFAIEVDDYEDKEVLLHSLFSRSRVSNTELFSLNVNEVVQLLSSFDGKIIYPEQQSRNIIFETATEAIQSLSIPDGTYKLDVKPKNGSVRVKALMIVKDGVLTVQKGAVLGNVTRISVAGWADIRNSLKTNGNVTTEDFVASSPSMAAAIILGHNTNGWKTWKNSDNEYIDVYRSVADTNEID
ncbi:MAG: DUF4357 domain-containing protein [Clostridia bacterium]|nr:DUF4357 domain-containing protein [Clostridia bacterium]